jgi:hypothetical protein
MQAAFDKAHHRARRNIDVVFPSTLPNPPHRRSDAALISNSKPNYKFSLSISFHRQFRQSVKHMGRWTFPQNALVAQRAISENERRHPLRRLFEKSRPGNPAGRHDRLRVEQADATYTRDSAADSLRMQRRAIDDSIFDCGCR